MRLPRWTSDRAMIRRVTRDGHDPGHLLSAAYDVLANVRLPPPDLPHAFVGKFSRWIEDSVLPLCREIDAARSASSEAAPLPGLRRSPPGHA
jgi:hypothetical protein